MSKYLFCFRDVDGTFGRNSYEVFASTRDEAEKKIKEAGCKNSIMLCFMTENIYPDCPLKLGMEGDNGKE